MEEVFEELRRALSVVAPRQVIGLYEPCQRKTPTSPFQPPWRAHRESGTRTQGSLSHSKSFVSLKPPPTYWDIRTRDKVFHAVMIFISNEVDETTERTTHFIHPPSPAPLKMISFPDPSTSLVPSTRMNPDDILPSFHSCSILDLDLLRVPSFRRASRLVLNLHPSS